MNKQYSISEFARRIGRSPATVRRWGREGVLATKRLPSGHRFFDEDDVRSVLGIAAEKRRTVVYCRVSSHGQKDDLSSQLAALEQYCLAAGIPVDEWIKEIGGGMNFRRTRFLALVERIQRGEIRQRLIAHKDRLMRFGFDFFSHIAEENGGEIVVVNQESLSPEPEMVEELMAIVHSCSCRVYGLRTYQQQIKTDFAGTPIRQPTALCA